MQQILTAIWLQDFDSLQVVNPINILLLLLAVVLLTESCFIFLPLPGVGLTLFVGGLVSIEAVDYYNAVILLSAAASIGSIFAYLQGRWLHGTTFMYSVERRLPPKSQQRAKTLLEKHGVFILFLSQFLPFLRALIPLLMGATRVGFIHAVLTSITSSLIWTMTLLFIGTRVMRHPLMAAFKVSITKWFLVGSFLLFTTVLITLLLHWIRHKQ
ncbi:DedA family protein [Photobacterium lutimaris]|uniref:DedA family protein n=1 Tax=Photobacterium lutimaris TaxID=388278 RepID=A0A2T3J0K9_9GAMM|nr:DedA family protein [Photobacterium lutimaris]PSU34625.1 DedA family protein [Photobacterium lutimaris]TDR71530.1 membrane protein DedA with SNARE-associated domain [Photobacterium lutimaris]